MTGTLQSGIVIVTEDRSFTSNTQRIQLTEILHTVIK